MAIRENVVINDITIIGITTATTDTLTAETTIIILIVYNIYMINKGSITNMVTHQFTFLWCTAHYFLWSVPSPRIEAGIFLLSLSFGFDRLI